MRITAYAYSTRASFPFLFPVTAEPGGQRTAARPQEIIEEKDTQNGLPKLKETVNREMYFGILAST